MEAVPSPCGQHPLCAIIRPFNEPKRVFDGARERRFEGEGDLILMSKVCEVCGKHPVAGNRVSNSQRHTRRRWMPNLQRVKAQTPGGRVHMRVCTSCLKAGKVRRAI